ncbi:E3 ubiquitin-protein ligase rnf213-alpha-like isoform X3 [Dysidea avara]|uniref:E3 ubiquitin-protein ligase rnf213-alpha-like isoform X3 n=1 Tax=Dysidea avara TaxID=196820 RepID=UPI0033330C94
MSGAGATTIDEVVCPQCNERVPRKKFCFECGEPLVIVKQPTSIETTDSGSKIRVQVSDSVPSVVGNMITDSKKENLNTSPKNTPVALTSSATTETTIVVNADKSSQGSPSTTTSVSSYSVVVSQCQPESSGQHTARPPADASPDKSAGSYPSNSLSAGNGKKSTESSVTNDKVCIPVQCQSGLGNHFQVTFHLLVPSQMWNWNDHCRLSIRHGFNTNNKDFEELFFDTWHDQYNQLYQAVEIRARMRLPVYFLNKKRAYKYTVHHSTNQCVYWEWLYNLPGQYNRCLEFDQNSSISTSYHVYDGFVFPSEKRWDKIYHYSNSTGINTKNAWEIALALFLQKHKIVYTETEDFDITGMCETICGIYFHIKQKTFMPFKSEHRPISMSNSEHLDNGVRKWILNIVSYLDHHRSSSYYAKVWSAKVVMALATIIRKTAISPPSESDALRKMLKYLQLEKPQYEHVVATMDESLRDDVARSIAHLCSVSMATNKALGTPLWEWLLAVPLFHQLQFPEGVDHMYIDPEKPDWGMNGLDRDRVWGFRSIVQFQKMFHKLFTNLRAAAADDPLLLRLLVYLSSEDDVDVVLSHAPAHYFAIHVSQICCGTYERLTKNKMDKLNNVVTTLFQSVAENVDLNHFRCHCLMLATNKILGKLAEICDNTPDHTAILLMTIKLYLSALSAYYKSSQLANNDEQVTNCVTDAQVCVIKWLLKPEVGLGDYFGGKNGKKIKNEIKLWNGFLGVSHTDQVLPCIQQEWQKQLQHIIKERVHHEQMEVSTKIQLAVEVCDTKEYQSINPILSEIIWKSVADSMEDDAAIKKVLPKKANKSVGMMLCTLLGKFHEKREINLTTMFKFWLWPEYLQHYAYNDDLAQEYNDESKKKCKQASIIIKDLSERLEHGKITIHELDMLTKDKDKTIKLLPSVVSNLDADNVEKLLNQRNCDVKKFVEYCSLVKMLLCYCKDIAKGDLIDNLEDGLRTVDSEEEYCQLKICQLYEVINGIEVYAILNIEDKDVLDMLKPFSIMMRDNKTVIADAIWNDHVRKQVSGIKLSLPEVATVVWSPCLMEIQQTVERFHDRSVTLQEVDHYLKDISTHNLRQEVFTFVEGCNKCLKPAASVTWVSNFVVSVERYRVVCQAHCASELVLKAKDALMITGDFKKLESLKEKISKHMTVSLKKFEDEGYHEIEGLENIASSQDYMKFLKVLSNSRSFIEWLQRETTDVIELQNLISMFEEDVCTMDRIAQLHTVGSAIAPLVYDLKKDSNLDEFLRAFNLLKIDAKLSALLAICSKDLRFYKQVKDFRMPVEIGTYDQVKAILEDGEYFIGSKKQCIFHRVEDIVTLRIKKSAAKQRYNLNDLKELESKVVLIRDHSSSTTKAQHSIAEGVVSADHHSSIVSDKLASKDIEKFLNILHLVVHIADSLLHLQRAGNPQYIDWFKSCSCNTVNEKELEDLNQRMKRELQDWLTNVSSLRKRLYALNYFTCLQLLKISCEFYQLINNPEHHINKEIFLLLLSVSPDLTVESVKQVMSSTEAQTIALKSVCFNPLPSTQDETFYIIGEIDVEVENLSEEEKEIFTSVTTDFEYDPHLVLTALRHKGCDEEAVIDWCMDNAKMYEIKSTSDNLPVNKPESIEIDSSNSTVKELVDLEFSEAVAIEAVKACGEDIGKCLDYCSTQILSKSFRESNNGLPNEELSIEMDTASADNTDSSLSNSNSIEDLSLEVFSNFITLEGTGMLLDELAKVVSKVQSPRPFPSSLERGTPNFLSVAPCEVFKAVVSLYARDKTSPLPSLDEVLICNHETTVEEISLLWYRAVKDPDHKRIFCLVSGEKLSYQVCTEALDEMDKILKGETGYHLVIVCSNEHKEEKSYIMEHLQLSYRDAAAVIAKDDVIYSYLNHHMSRNVTYESQKIFASDVDCKKCSVRVIRSERTGMGKSLYISRMERELKKKFKKEVKHPIRVIIPIHGPDVDLDAVMKHLQHHMTNVDPINPPAQIFHFDIAPSVIDNVDALLFSILVLKGFVDSSGTVWRCFPQQLYLVEVTYRLKKQGKDFDDTKNSNTLEFLKFIPTLTCCSPMQASIAVISRDDMIYQDNKELSSKQYQRPFQYLLQLSDHSATLDTYSYSQPKNVDCQQFFNTVLRHFADCGVRDPSWMELRHFLYFLNAQLEDCESSIYCNTVFIKDALPGFKKFVVEFMLKMAKDFAVPSLKVAMRSVQVFSVGMLYQQSPHSHRSVSPDAVPIDPTVTSNVSMDPSGAFEDEIFSTSTPSKAISIAAESDLHQYTDTVSHSESTASNIPSSKASTESSDTEGINCLAVDTMIIEQLQFHPSRVWDRNVHPYIFFNQDHTSMTFIGFFATDRGDLVDPVTKEVFHKRILTPKLRNGLKAQQVTFMDDDSNNQEELLVKLLTVMGINMEILYRHPDNSYVLTADNTKKIMAILMRFRCNIPVILMGETGCGKTRLIKYMCELLSLNSPDNGTLVIMKVHGGVTEDDIIKEVTKARELAKKNAKDGLETVMFFDEANTTEAIGLIKEVMCDKRIRGEPIEENVKFIAACNPYKKHSPEMIRKLERAGLGYYVQSVNTKQKLGIIPLRHLVYRVLDLPSSMQSLVYDFGQLSSETEQQYTKKIVERYAKNIQSLDVDKVTEVLTACQNYMRERKDECSFVSLRDIERAMIVLEWFHSVLPDIESQYQGDNIGCNHQTRALILSIAVCYYAKLQRREDFEEYISPLLISSFFMNTLFMLRIDDARTVFKREIIRCQEIFLNNMKLPPNIARNTALRENVFMMVVCIELKIPLFLVGKPGSSKSLAKSIVADSMQGAASSSPLFRKFKQVQLFSYQCSQHSTSETILEVFNNATRFQEKKKGQNCISVVVLDEVGLAEDSPSLPLKTLHPLLEDGTTSGSSDVADRVAFIGISNWALDPAKMNRGIMVTRDDPGVEELVLSAKGICCSSDGDQVCERLERFFEPFAKAYTEICEEQAETQKEFFGLRDFYSLIKMMYWISQTTGKCLTMNHLQHCLKRNFGGKVNVDEMVERFLRNVPAYLIVSEQRPSDVEYYDCTSHGLIKASLQSKDRSWHGETRYLLFLTENYSALRILQQANLLDHDPLILFGSSFPEDLNYTQVCRNINQIKFCMDTGRTVILLNLEHLYESLYDVLNQYYITLSDKKYVDLGLQSHRIKCRVHPDFKLVLIAEKDKVYEEFPTPLINRLEKHYLVTSTILTDKQEVLLKEIINWVEEFLQVSTTMIDANKFSAGDSFVGYQTDTPASIVFKVFQEIDFAKFSDNKQWEKEALSKSIDYLLQIATPDSIARSKFSKLFTKWIEISAAYFRIHSYSSLDGLLSNCLGHASDGGIVIQITTHGALLQRRDLLSLHKSINYKKEQISFFKLQQFNTEMDFGNRIKAVIQRDSADDHLIIIQCDSGHKHSDLIACARYRVLDEKTQAAHLNNTTHVVFIIGLPRRNGGTKFVSFQGGKWESYHVDSLVSPKDSLFTIKQALTTPINELLSDCYNQDTELLQRRLQHCVSLPYLLPSSNDSVDQAMERFSALSQMVKDGQISGDSHINQSLLEDSFQQISTNQQIFCKALLQHIFKYLKTKKDIQPQSYKQSWAIKEALDAKSLHESGSYINALSLKVDRVIATALSNILNIVDKYCNLQLLLTEDTVIATLWLGIFEDSEIVDVSAAMEFTDSDSNNALFATFQCQFPFFWLLINSIESQWKISAIKRSLDVYNILKSKSIAEKLMIVGNDHIQEIFKCYVHDFVLFTCGLAQENDHTKLIEQIVHNEHHKMMTQNELPDLENMLLHQIILLHEAYHRLESQLHHLKQITTINTSISSRVQTYFTAKEMDIGIDLYAVQEMLTILKPNFKSASPEYCKQWLRSINNCQNTVDATISAAVKTHGSSPTSIQIKKDWQLLRVLQIFVEHTIDYVPAVTIKYAMRMHMYLQKDHDFSTLKVYDRLKKTIDCYACDDKIQFDLRISDPARNSCCMLFLEIVSEVIFAVSSTSAVNDPPEDDLVAKLIETVIPSTGSTQQISPLTDSKADNTPVIRSYLLQLLLDFNVGKIRDHLQTYFSNSCDVMKEDTSFLVLCVQCFEDSLHKQASRGSFSDAVQLAIDSLEFGKQYIFAENINVVALNYVESVASFRYTLVTVARVLHDYYLDPASVSMLSHDDTKIAGKLLSSVQRLCLAIDENSNQETHFVADFLLKSIVRKYGMSTFMTLCTKVENLDFSWVMPAYIQQDPDKTKESKAVDPFLIYGKRYVDIRDSLITAQEENAISSFQILKPTNDDGGPVLLSLFSTVCLSHLCDPQVNDSPQDFDVQILANLEKHICSSVFDTSSDLAKVASQLIYNFQGCSSPLLTITPKKELFEQQFCAIVVHTAAVLMCSDSNTLIVPLQHLAMCSSTIQKMYFPTMPHDELFETADSTRKVGRIYKCQNGHPFIVTECGRPMQLATCQCGAPIGGERHKLTAGNFEYKREDTTQTGHLLGPVDHLSKQATPERDLSPVTCTITRLIMHAALTWSSVCVADGAEILTKVVHPAVTPANLPQFFLDHLTHDLNLLSKVLGISTDDTALIIHLILKGMHDFPQSGSTFDLSSKDSRQTWEKKFSASYILPILKEITSKLKSVQELVIDDSRQAHNALLQIAYEKNTDDNPAAAMWRYRSRITIEHLGFFIEQQKSKVECPILKEFLKQEIKLRATQYLPDIVQLQQILYKQYNYTFDEEEVSQLTIQDLQSEENSTLKKLVESFHKAWQLVRSFLPNYGRRRIPKEYIKEMWDKPQSIPLPYLIPTATGKGICSTALVDFLVSAHNDFIEFYHGTIKNKGLKQTLPLKDLQKCYLVADEQQFMSIVMSHCHYSLTRGKGTEVEYDIPALERHFLNRFVHGRPLFDLSTACVVLQRKSLHNSTNFAAIRKNITPQKTIPLEIKRAIIDELGNSNRLREVLEIINTILTILANPTTKDNAYRPIGQYAEEILKHKLPAKIKNCNLSNAISLWETIAVEQAKRAVLDDQDPFKDISDDFKDELNLPAELESKFYASLKKFHADQLLGSLYQFIVIYISSCPVMYKDWPLIDTFPEFLEQEELDVPGLGAKVKSSMPKSIMLCHVVDMFKRIVKNEAKASATDKRSTSLHT